MRVGSKEGGGYREGWGLKRWEDEEGGWGLERGRRGGGEPD